MPKELPQTELEKERVQVTNRLLELLRNLEDVAPVEDVFSVPFHGTELANEVGWSDSKRIARGEVENIVNASNIPDKKRIIDQASKVIDDLQYHVGIFKSRKPDFQKARNKMQNI